LPNGILPSMMMDFHLRSAIMIRVAITLVALRLAAKEGNERQGRCL